MKRLISILVALAFCMGTFAAAAMASGPEAPSDWTPESLEPFAYEDEEARYWSKKNASDYALWGEYKKLDSGETMICPNVLGLHVQDGIVTVIVDDGWNVFSKNDAQLYFIFWNVIGQKAIPERREIWSVSNYSPKDAPVLFNNLIQIGEFSMPGSDFPSRFVASSSYKGTLWLHIYTASDSGSLPHYSTACDVGKYKTAALHTAGYFYFTSAKGELAVLTRAELSREQGDFEAEKLGSLQKGTLPVDGATYLGWLTPKGELAYTMDGTAVETLSVFPEGTVFEFYEGFIVAKYSDYYLAKLTPGGESASISLEEYGDISKAFPLLISYPEAG